MGAETSKTAEAAAANESSDTPAGAGEFSPEMMTNVFSKFGRKPPVALKTESEKKTEPQKPAGAEAKANDGDETPVAADTEADQGEAGETDAGAEADASVGDEAPVAADTEAGESETPPATDEQAEQLKAETARLLKIKLKDLQPETRAIVQSIMDGRIAAITGKAKSENDRLSTRVTELTGEVDTLRKDGPVPVIVEGIPPAMMAETPEQIDQALEPYKEFQKWAVKNADGFNLKDSDNYDENQKTWTAAEIRARSYELQEEKAEVKEAARQKLADKAKQDEQVRTALPAMFNPASPEYAQARQILKAQPQLRARADQNVIIAQIILGQRALQQLQNPGRKTGNSAPNAGRTTAGNGAKPPQRRAPRAPGDGAPAFGSPLDRPNQRPDPGSAVKHFTANRTPQNFRKAVEALVFR